MYPYGCSCGIVDDPRHGIATDNNGVFLGCEEGISVGVMDSKVVGGDSGGPCEGDGFALVYRALGRSALSPLLEMDDLQVWKSGTTVMAAELPQAELGQRKR